MCIRLERQAVRDHESPRGFDPHAAVRGGEQVLAESRGARVAERVASKRDALEAALEGGLPACDRPPEGASGSAEAWLLGVGPHGPGWVPIIAWASASPPKRSAVLARARSKTSDAPIAQPNESAEPALMR